MAMRHFCDRCGREIVYGRGEGATGVWDGGWGAHIGMDLSDAKELKWAHLRKDLCGDCATEIEAFVLQKPVQPDPPQETP